MYDNQPMPEILRNFLMKMEIIKGMSKNTVNAYFHDLRTFLRFLILHKNNSLDTIDFNSVDISQFNAELLNDVNLSILYEYLFFINREKNNAERARSRKVASIRTFFKYLKNEGIIKENPAKELDSPKLQKKMPDYLTLDEAKKLLSSISGKDAIRDICIITLFLNCGLRLSELCGINFNSIRENKLTVLGKGNKERTIFLNNACISAIANYIHVRPVDGVKDADKDALFLSYRKSRLSQRGVQKIIENHLKAAGLDTTKYSVHKLRHTAATLLYKYGDVDIRILQEILGHKNIATTEIYTHIDNQQLEAAIKKNPLGN